MRPWAPLLLVARGALVGGDFVFVDFNETQGLRLNGDAETSACAAEAGRAHGLLEDLVNKTLGLDEDQTVT